MTRVYEDWDENRIALLTKFWKGGLTASQIAAQLGTTRNAVIGKVNRLGIAKRPKPVAKPKAKAAEPAPPAPAPAAPKRTLIQPHEAEAIIRLTKRGWSFRQIAANVGRDRTAVAKLVRKLLPDYQPRTVQVVRPAAPATKPAGERVVALLEARPFQCRWMVSRTHVCGERTGGGSWCGYHRQIVYSRPEPAAAFREAAE